ncbi:hypothetical protein CHELA40_13438 [Chelatococcus asaccharovorans]|nr:hypothetical protein CHELA40_13438 [Chelatococcus asaccharovorans]CAH1678024.1 hypothetical protein CHELA17_62182 [Chelatococcus asaccharovorans]
MSYSHSILRYYSPREMTASVGHPIRVSERGCGKQKRKHSGVRALTGGAVGSPYRYEVT